MPKKADKSGASHPGYEERLRHAADLPEVLGILEEAQQSEQSRTFFFQALSVLAQKAAEANDAKSKRAAVQQGEWLLESCSKLDGGKPQESAVTSMVRVCCACGAQERALRLVAEVQAKGVKPRLRTLSAVLLQASEAGDRTICEKLWAQLPSLQLEPQDLEFAIMLRTFRGEPQRQYVLLRQLIEELPMPSDPPLIEEIGRVFGVEGAAALRCLDPPKALGRAEDGRRWQVGWTSLSPEGLCALSGHSLQALDVTPEDESDAAPGPSGDHPAKPAWSFLMSVRWFGLQSFWRWPPWAMSVLTSHMIPTDPDPAPGLSAAAASGASGSAPQLLKAGAQGACVAAIDMDCFYAQCEEIRQPELKGKPLGVQQKMLVITSNYAARAFGIKKGDSLQLVRQKCPEIAICNGEDLTFYSEISQRVFEVASRFSPRVERLGLDEVFVDLGDQVTERLKGGAASAAQSFRGALYPSEGADVAAPDAAASADWAALDDERRCAVRLAHASELCLEIRKAILEEVGLTSSAGVSVSKMLAKMVEALAALLPDALGVQKIPGIGFASTQRCHELGVTCLKDLAEAGDERLAKEFEAAQVRHMRQLCLGLDLSPVRSSGCPKSCSAEDSFWQRPLRSFQEVQASLVALAEKLLAKLRTIERGFGPHRAASLAVSWRQAPADEAPGGARARRERRQAPLAESCAGLEAGRLAQCGLGLFQKTVKEPFALNILNLQLNLGQTLKGQQSLSFKAADPAPNTVPAPDPAPAAPVLLSDEEAPAPKAAAADLAQLVAMGFCAERAAEALQAAGGVEGAVEALLSSAPASAPAKRQRVELVDLASIVFNIAMVGLRTTGTSRIEMLMASKRSRLQEEALLERMVTRLAVDGVRNSGKPFRRFKKWLEEQPPFDIVIDGANVGFNNQNREGGLFQYSQIDAVIDKLRENGSRVLLVLHPKWLREDADRTVTKRKKRKLDQINLEGAMGSSEETAEEQEGEPEIQYPFDPITEAERDAPVGTPLSFIRRWKESECLVRVPAKDCDDWYWLFAALSSARRGARHVQVVSNDHMRDHHWRMVGNRAFLKWQGRHMTRVSIWSETVDGENCKVTLTPPDLYSLQAQVSDNGEAWHFPVPVVPSRAQQLSSGRPLPRKEIESAECHWLVAWQ
ncbi:unnamed protein product [Effrenium voratum]|uniref:Uncharacterized protein n=1 Tax=Effrenium voratum TaxID=2562239 RepID=A0AA36I4G0_9DINO|nr:unnamed protein product [Effrenium voratum]